MRGGKRKFRELVRGSCLCFSVLVLAGYFIFSFELFESLELWLYDEMFYLRGKRADSGKVVIVSIDDETTDNLELDWPFPRSLHAKLIRKLSEYGARVIVFDIPFTYPSLPERRCEDEELIAAAAEAGNVVIISKYESFSRAEAFNGERARVEQFSHRVPFRKLRDAVAYGFANVRFDRDGAIRKRPLIFFREKKYLTSVVFEALKKYAESFHPGPAGEAKGTVEVQIERGKNARIGPFSVPLLPDDSYYINYVGPAGSFIQIPFYSVLAGNVEEGHFRDRIVLVGGTFVDSHDDFATPFLVNPDTGVHKRTFGVEIIANAIDTVLTGKYILPATQAMKWAMLLFVGLPFIILTLAFPVVWSAVLVLPFLYLPFHVSYYLFTEKGIYLPPGGILVAMSTAYAVEVIFRLRTSELEKKMVKDTFSRYVSDTVVARILEEGISFPLKGENRDVSVLFADIRGFTELSERVSPEELVQGLNSFFAAAIDVIIEKGGTLDKFIGDCVMAVFGAPVGMPDDATASIEAAIEIQLAVEKLNQEREKNRREPLNIGIGINSGTVTAGNIGSKRRMEYTVIGDNVNVAARLQEKAGRGEIIVSGSTYEKAKKKFRFEKLERMELKGKKCEVEAYRVLWR